MRLSALHNPAVCRAKMTPANGGFADRQDLMSVLCRKFPFVPKFRLLEFNITPEASLREGG